MTDPVDNPTDSRRTRGFENPANTPKREGVWELVYRIQNKEDRKQASSRPRRFP